MKLTFQQKTWLPCIPSNSKNTSNHWKKRNKVHTYNESTFLSRTVTADLFYQNSTLRSFGFLVAAQYLATTRWTLLRMSTPSLLVHAPETAHLCAPSFLLSALPLLIKHPSNHVTTNQSNRKLENSVSCTSSCSKLHHARNPNKEKPLIPLAPLVTPHILIARNVRKRPIVHLRDGRQSSSWAGC
jgi:hypothetical protein